MVSATMTTDPAGTSVPWEMFAATVTGPVAGVWTITAGGLTQPVLDMHVTNAVAEAAARASLTARRAKLAGAKARARQITSLAQSPAARTATAWTQPQRVAVLDAVSDLALMLSWLADDMLAEPGLPD